MPLAPAGGAWDWRITVEVVDLDSPKLLMVGNKLRPMIVRSCHLVQTIWGGGGELLLMITDCSDQDMNGLSFFGNMGVKIGTCLKSYLGDACLKSFVSVK